jgi:hypothetical protein
VDCVVVPPSVPEGLNDSVTATPAEFTGLLFASSSCTDTLGSVEPEATDAGIVVVIDSTAPVPEATLNAPSTRP